MSTKELVEAVKAGKLTPEAAVRRAEAPARHISEIGLDNLRVDILDCGFPCLNEWMVFKKGRPELIIFGARPSMGKSAFVFQTAAQVAAKGRVLIYSLEMDYDSIVARMVAAKSGRGLTNVQKGSVPIPLLKEAKSEIDKLDFWVDDRGGIDVKTIRASAVAFHERTPVDLVVVDYLQMVRSRERNSRNDEVGEVSAELKALAKDLNCPVLVAAQLNRECEKRGKSNGGDYMPILSDLRDSGNIEQDADIVLFLSRQFVYDSTRPGEADIGVAKNRNGATGRAVFSFLANSTRFIDRTPEKKAPAPNDEDISI